MVIPFLKGETQVKKFESLINRKIAQFNDDIIRQKVARGGCPSKQDFWEMKKILAPMCNTVPHCTFDSLG